MSYPRMKTRLTTEPGRVTVHVEHHPAQSYSRAVYPAAMRLLNTAAGRVALAQSADTVMANVRAVELDTMDTDAPETFDGRPTWNGGPVERTTRTVTRYTFAVVTR